MIDLVRKHFNIFLSGVIGLVAASLISYLNLEYLEALLYDYRVQVRPAPVVSQDIVLVMIKPSDVEKFKGTPSFQEHSQMLSQLLIGKPRAIVYTIPLREVRGEENEKADFAKEATKFGTLGLSNAEKTPYLIFQSNDFVMKGEEDEKLRLPPPLDQLQVESGPRLLDATLFAKDGVSRRMMLTYQNHSLLHTKLAGLMLNPNEEKELPSSKIRGSFSFMETDQAYIDFAPRNSYKQISFYEVYTNQFPKDSLKDKLVFVGLDLEDSVRHYVPTPYNRDPNGMTVTELHANAVDTLIRNSAPIRIAGWFEAIFVFLISACTTYVILTARPTQGLLIILSLVITFTTIGYFAFWPLGIWVGMAAPYLAIFLCYYFLIPYRLIIENRKTWELTEKNRLLVQVEELKNNFISMMSHDLKTPLARIQGMTDMVQREGPELNIKQKEALLNIRASSEDLLNFISSILNFSRIESQGVELHLQSRDINNLIKEVVKKLEFAAKIKNIELILELEPLFSIQIDGDLIKQVISNLIENAIKYSTEGSKVLITTEEKEGYVVLQVADQGAGISAEDLPNIFMKFFRSKAAKASPIKGSGIGLYLAHYFVSLHKGRIYVESTLGQGSTFTVELPITPAIPANS